MRLQANALVRFSMFAILVLLGGRAVPAQNNASDTRRVDSTAEHHVLARRLAVLLRRDLVQVLNSAPSHGGPDSAFRTAFDSIVVNHMAKYVTVDTTVALAAAEYERLFSVRDLRQILVFLESPPGVNFLDVQRRASQSVRPAIDSLLAPHQVELQQAIQALMARQGPRPRL